MNAGHPFAKLTASHRLFLLWLLIVIACCTIRHLRHLYLRRTNQCNWKDSTETKKKTRRALVAIKLFCKPTATASHGNHHVGQPLRCIIDEFGRYVILIRFEFLALCI